MTVRLPTRTSAVTGMPGTETEPRRRVMQIDSVEGDPRTIPDAPLAAPVCACVGIGTEPDGFRASSCALKLSGLMIRTTPCAMPYCVYGNVSNLIATVSPT